MRGGREAGMCKLNFLFSVAQCLARRAIGAAGLAIESLMLIEKNFGGWVRLQVRKEVVLP